MPTLLGQTDRGEPEQIYCCLLCFKIRFLGEDVGNGLLKEQNKAEVWLGTRAVDCAV
jgi:hypothetical protein